MKAPIEQLLDTVDWKTTGDREHATNSDLPYATHEGVLELGGLRLRCYRLNTGQAIFHADDVRRFFNLEER